MVVSCTIEFDNNPFGTYFAGQIMSGRITLTADKAKKVRGVALKINGFAHTSWSESSSRTVTDSHGKTTTVTDTTWYTGHEDYLASVTYVLGSSGGSSCVIEPGIHTYNFSCHLPVTCPSSFEGIHGHVRYIVRVALIRPWKFDQTFTKGFTVLKVMDLNYDSPLLRMPCHMEVLKTFCCGPCRSEPLRLQLNLPQTGFVPGQSIPIELLINNESRVPVEDIKIELVMLIVYYAQSPCSRTNNERLVISKLKGGEKVLRHITKRFNYDLYVPPTPPTCFNLCRIIQIAYQVEVVAKVKGTHTNQTLSAPVTIGNVPLMGGVIVQQPSGTANMQRGFMAAMENGPGRSTNALTVEDTEKSSGTLSKVPTAPSPWTADSNIPPPSYEEAVHILHGKINADEAHDYGQTDFTPRYPVFSLPTPSAPADTDDVDSSFVIGLSEERATEDVNNGTWL